MHVPSTNRLAETVSIPAVSHDEDGLVPADKLFTWYSCTIYLYDVGPRLKQSSVLDPW